MASVKVRRFGSNVMLWKSYYDEEMPPQLFPVISKDEYRESIRRINAIYRPLPWMKYSLIAGLAGVILGVVLIGVLFMTKPMLSVAGFVVIAVSVCFLAIVNRKITNTVRVMLCTATAYENQVYRERVPPVRWVVDEWRLITTTVTTGGRGGARTSRSSQTFFDLHVEVGQAVQPQTVVVHQHMYAAPAQYGPPPVGYAPQYGQPPAGPYGAPPAGYPPQQWNPTHAHPPPQSYYGQPPAVGQQWPIQSEAAPVYNREDPLGGPSNDSDTGSSKLLSSTQQSDA